MNQKRKIKCILIILFSLLICVPITFTVATINTMALANDVETNDNESNIELEKMTPSLESEEIYVDIKPGSWPNPINLKSKGVTPIAICGTELFDVITIDLASVHIGGVFALRWSYEDVATPFEGQESEGHALNGDGYTDLVLHFKTQEILDVLALTDFAGQTLPIEIEGNLKEEDGGALFKGSDYVWILGGEKWFILDPIFIDNQGGGDYTWKEAKKQPWCKGAGTLKKPYIIENVIIDAAGTGSYYCINIANSDANFIIRNCILYGIDTTVPSAAILLSNIENGMIINNFCFDNGDPQGLFSSGISIIDSDNNILKENNCTRNGGSGIYLQSSNNNVIVENYCNENAWGILLWDAALIDSSEYNHIIRNVCIENEDTGIVIEGSHHNIVKENLCKGSIRGISIGVNAENNIVTKNDCILNTISSSTGKGGIILYDHASNNYIQGNNCSDNSGNGILLSNFASDNTIEDNFCKNNDYGISIGNGASYNEIFENDIIKNWQIGIVLWSKPSCDPVVDTDIYHNNIIDNVFLQAWDDYRGLNNWDGNYWSDYHGEDNDYDGRGDTSIPWPYLLSGFDNSPYMVKNGWE